MSEKQMKILGWVATFMSVMMYVSYFPQIMNNLAGQREFHPAFGCSDQLQSLGLLWTFQKGQRYTTCSNQCTWYCFGLVTAITALI